MSKSTRESIFKTHAKIRWTAFLTENGLVNFCQMRPRVLGYTSNEVDRSSTELGASQQLCSANTAESAERIIFNFEKDCALITKIKNEVLAISVHHIGAFDNVQEIADSLNAL
jgi:hypothetical protein